jgi:hypothetical protein
MCKAMTSYIPLTIGPHINTRCRLNFDEVTMSVVAYRFPYTHQTGDISETNHTDFLFVAAKKPRIQFKVKNTCITTTAIVM